MCVLVGKFFCIRCIGLVVLFNFFMLGGMVECLVIRMVGGVGIGIFDYWKVGCLVED